MNTGNAGNCSGPACQGNDGSSEGSGGSGEGGNNNSPSPANTPVATPTSPFGTVPPPPTSTVVFPYIQMTQPYVIVQGPSQTPTPLPTNTPQPLNVAVAQWASDQINNADPYAPGLEQMIPMDCGDPYNLCETVRFVNTVYNELLYTLVILNDISPGSSSSPNNGTPTLSPTPTTIPASSTSSPQFQTPVISPTVPLPTIWRSAP